MPDPEGLRAKMPLHDINIGQDTVQRGRELDEPDLTVHGWSMQAMTVHVAVHDSDVPEHIVEEVVDIALENGLEPERTLVRH